MEKTKEKKQTRKFNETKFIFEMFAIQRFYCIYRRCVDGSGGIWSKKKSVTGLGQKWKIYLYLCAHILAFFYIFRRVNTVEDVVHFNQLPMDKKLSTKSNRLVSHNKTRVFFLLSCFITLSLFSLKSTCIA